MAHEASESVLGRLRQAAARMPERTAVKSGPDRVTFAELDEQTDRFAATLTDRGVNPGNRVALLLGNSPTFVRAYLACLKAGGVVVPCNPSAPPAVLADVLTDCAPVAAVVQPRHTRFLDDIASPTHVFVEGSPAGAWPVEREERRSHKTFPPPATHHPPSDLAAIIYTSGTTGRPKGVMLTHDTLLHVALAGRDMLNLGEDDRVGIVTPLHHLYGLREIDLALIAGATLLLPQQLTFPAHVLKQMQVAGVTGFSAVPSGLSLMLERYGAALAACAGQLRYLTMGTAPASPALLAALHSLLPRTRLITTYGLTEMSRVCWREVRDPHADEGIGRPYCGVEIRLQDAVDGRGRVLVRSPMLMRGYWNLPEATQAAFDAEGFLLTPDYGRLAPDGTLYLLGRIDDVINCGGEKVSPDEVEDVLRSHPQVTEAAVVAAPDPAGILGQIVRAVVVRRPGAPLAAEELQRYAAASLEPNKVPRLVEFVESLPRTELGKPRRALLRQTRGG
jgi:acyl-CoA synthetase (AMP-forming)/AMP-acid ligase II